MFMQKMISKNEASQSDYAIITYISIKELFLICIFFMQDISQIPAWDPATVLAELEKTPLDQKILKAKLDKLYQISAYNELEYVGEVLEAYAWIKLSHERQDFSKYFVNEKSEKWFLEQFVATAIRYMIICRRFKHVVLMVLTQQMIVEGLRLYSHKFDQLDRFPRMTSILKTSLEFDKQFYKLNYINDYPFLYPSPTEADVAKIDQFLSTIKNGDPVDFLKVDTHSKRFCWLPGTVKKQTSLSIQVQTEWDRNVIPLDKKGMCVYPSGSKEAYYIWRRQLKQGDFVDFQDNRSLWVKAKVAERKEQSDSQGKNIDLLLQWEEQSEWISLSDPRIQQCGLFSSESNIPRSVTEGYLDDYNDLLLDPEMKSVGIIRSQYNKSILLIDFINVAQNELKLLDRALQAVQSRKFGIQVTADLVGCIASLHPLLHRKFAIRYLPQMIKAVLDFVNKADELTIRNFSKERFETINLALTEFLKRVKPSAERKYICEQLQLNLTIRFLQSDFLDRKLYAVSLLTTLLKQSKHRVLRRSVEQLLGWVREKGVLPLIYNEKSHSELIARSSDFLQYYLLNQPNSEQLQPLLEWNESILKLVNDCYEYLPEDFREELVLKIKQKTNVTNKDALDIIKRTSGCQSWLLNNGGQSWVSVVKEKTKKKDLIAEVFTHPFAVVEKITKEVSQLYQCRFKTEFFLQLHDANYLPKVLQDQNLPFIKRVQFAAIAIETSSQIKDDLFQALAPHTRRMDELPSEAQAFFVALLPKLHSRHVNQLFRENFTDITKLEVLGAGQFNFFRAVFFRLNEQQRFIERKIISVYPTHHSTRKQRRQILTIRANPNQLLGMKQLMSIVFGSNDLKVTQNALEFIGFLFDHLSPELAASVVQFRSTLLESCLEKLYASINNQEKYLRIISGLLDESEKGGIDAEPAVNAMFLTQSLTLRIVDHFNVNKSRMLMEVPAHLTLHELKGQLARQLNAYPHQLKLLLGDKELDPRLNGRVIHTLNLNGADLVAEKKSTVEKVGLCEADGSLTEKCKGVLRSMFREYSQCGLMSKPQCQKYHQRCVGEVSSLSENKVDKIYDQYDTDKDGYLTESDFLSFYEYSAKVRESTVWSNLQMFGIRNDLEDLRELEITYPESSSMVRHLLFNNEAFMALLIKFLQAPQPLATAAWQVSSRLPLLPREQFFALELDTSKPMLFRYWLYEVAAGERWELMTSEILEKLLIADIETTCIGLKAAIHSPQFQVQTFARILTNLKKINAQPQLSFHSQVVLDNTLKILQWFLKENEAIRAHFAEKHADYDTILTTGLLSKNATVRRMYCETVQTIITQSAEENIEIFEPFFRLIYTNFEKCDKATLSIQYFDLYSQLLQVLKQHTTLLPKLDLNWLILTKSMITLFLSHRSTQIGLNSPPDQVAQGYLRILRKLLDSSTVGQLVPLVKFLFQQSLFPESGKNKLKNAKSRREAYELLYAICSVRDEKGDSPGLQELFAAGFKAVYKKMSSNKSSTSSYGFSSYFYSYNEARSELGYAGIRNLGCICYMISMLQQLFMTQSFRSLVLMADDGQPDCYVKRASKQFDDNIFHQLQIMFANLELTQKQDYTPDQFCFSFKDFQGQSVNVSIQQDAQQFLNLFFDKIQTALKPTPFRRILEDSFGGKTCNQTICSNCKAVNERLQPFYPLSLQIKGYKNIEESFRKFIHGEVISDYQCDACKKKTDVTKSTLLAKVPNFFIIHLQRMCFNYDKFENEKVNSRWEFPNNLNVYPYTLDSQKGVGDSSDYEFSLKGVVLHYGSAEFGHYFSYIKESQNRWIQFNDERVREFDPHDIEVDCFGGEHWRRESQSAYLLVYEKVKKTPIHLEFDRDDEKDRVISQYSLKDSVIVHEEKKTEGQDLDEIKPLEKLDQEKQQTQIQQQGPKQPEKQKIIVELRSETIPTYVPEKLREKISKANEEFSFTLNLSNDQFAHFLHKILSIDPPDTLSTQYLELCYQCFPLRTLVDEQEGLTLSEWATKRFKEIIGGHGWEFLKSFGQNWESDILSIQRSTRIGMKNLLQCVISDIIRSSESSEQASVEKEALVRTFLQKFTEMMGGEVAKHWMRFREYFEVWVGLIAESQTVREWCRQVKMVERLLDFILEQYSPFAKEGHKKYTLRNMHYGAEFEFPLEVLTLLLKEGYELTDAEKNCMRHYAFLEKVIKFPAQHFNIIDYLCRDDRPLSEKFAYLILVETGKVSQSDEIKPIIASVHRFLEIKDDYEQLRVDWLIGFPQYIENARSNSYGVYGINPDQQVILNYISPVRSQPLTQQLIKFKSRAQHVACLLLSLLLQLEADGFIHNLDSFPSLFAFTHPYTFWFEEFVENYYEETHRSFIAKHYTEYGNRVKALWENRPKRAFPSHPLYLIGKTIEKTRAKKTETNELLQVETFDIESSLLELNEENAFLNKKNIKNFAGSEDFRVKVTNSYGGSGFLSMDRSNHSSDDQEPQEKKGNNPFDKVIKGRLLRKIVIKNLSYDSLLLVARLKSANPQPNFSPTNIEVSFEVKGGNNYVLTLQKKRVDEPFGEYSLELITLGQATREGYWPRQIISEVGENEHEDEEEGSEDSDEGSRNPVWVI